jgi:hypothetical protein
MRCANITLLLGRVTRATQTHRHSGKGERRDDQEIPHADVNIPAGEVRVDERPEEVVVVVPHAAEDV